MTFGDKKTKKKNGSGDYWINKPVNVLNRRQKNDGEVLTTFQRIQTQLKWVRHYTNKKDNSKGFKGSVFITFKDKESAENF